MIQDNHASSKQWWITSAIFSFLTMIVVGISFSLPANMGVILLGIGFFVFIGVFFLNPHYRYMRAASSIITAWLTSRGIPSVIGAFSTANTQLAFSFSNSTGWSYDVGCATVATVLFVLDYWQRNPNTPSRQISSFFMSWFHSNQQNAGDNSQQVQVGDITGNDNQIHITNIEATQNFHSEIDIAATFLKQGKPDIVIELLQKLKRQSWDRMSDRERFRILANLGHAHAQKDQYDEAGKYFIEAKEYQENEEQALALEANGYLSLGDNAKAFMLAEEVLEKFPNSETAMAVRILASTDDLRILEVEENIPTQLKNTEVVTHSLYAYAFRTNQFSEAIRLARQLLSLDESSHSSMEHLGSALINKVLLSRRAKNATIKDDDTRAELAEAIELLTKVIACDSIPSKATLARVRYNRALAYEYTGKPDLAEADLRGAIELVPNDEQFQYQFGLFLSNHGKTTEALKFFESASTTDLGVGPDLMRVWLLSKSNNKADIELAIELLEAMLPDIESKEEQDQFDIVDSLVSVYQKSKDSEKAEALLLKMQDKLTNASFLTIKAIVAHQCGDSTNALLYAKNAVGSLQEETPGGVSYSLGNLLAGLEEFKLASQTLKPITTVYCADSLINQALECAHMSKDFQFILDFCKSLRANNKTTSYRIELELVTLERLSEWETALQVIDEYLECPTDQSFANLLRLHKSRIGRQQDRPELIEYELDKLPDVNNVNVDNGCLVATLLSEGPNPLDGAEYAYELLRRYFNKYTAHQCYFGVMGLGEKGRIELPAPEIVQFGCAVKYSEKEGHEEWVILEDSPSPDISRNEIDPDTELGKELLNKSVGDEFYLRRDVVQDRTATIIAIMHKMDYRKCDVMDHWERRFPDEFFVRKYIYPKKEDGSLDVDAFVKSIQRIGIEKNKEKKRIDNIYQKNFLSTGHYSQLLNMSILEAILHLSHSEELPVRCCRGTGEEYDEAFKLIEDSVSIVVDGSALVTLYLTGVFERLKGLPFKVFVTERTLDIFRQPLRNKHDSIWSEKLLFDGIDDDAVEAVKEKMKNFTAWVKQSCEIQSAISLAKLSSEQRDEFCELFGPEAVESIALAVAENIPLWTDDFSVAESTKKLSEGGRIWSAIAFDKCVKEKFLSQEKANEFKVCLVDAGYQFTRMDQNMIDIALNAAHWNPVVRPLSNTIRWFHTSGIQQEGAVVLAGYLMRKAQDAAPLSHQKLSIMKCIINSLAKREDGVEILNIINQNLNVIFGLNSYAKSDCRKMIERELILRASERQLILPGKPNWGL